MVWSVEKEVLDRKKWRGLSQGREQTDFFCILHPNDLTQANTMAAVAQQYQDVALEEQGENMEVSVP